MAEIATIDSIILLLKEIDEHNPKDIITSVRIFSDGSGRVLQQGEECIADFNTAQEAVTELAKILNECLNKKIVDNKCTHDKIQMKSSGIWKCKCGYTHY